MKSLSPRINQYWFWFFLLVLGAAIQITASGILFSLSLQLPYTFGHISITLLFLLFPISSAVGRHMSPSVEGFAIFLIAVSITALPEIVMAYDAKSLPMSNKLLIVLMMFVIWTTWVILIIGKSKTIFDTPEFDLWELVPFILTIVAFRTISEWTYALDVPNEERSIFLFGYEVHHFIFGFVGLIFVWPLCRRLKRRTVAHRVARVIAAISLGMLWDQSIFLWVPGTPDGAYFQWPSWIGALAGCVLYGVSAFWVATRKGC